MRTRRRQRCVLRDYGDDKEAERGTAAPCSARWGVWFAIVSGVSSIRLEYIMANIYVYAYIHIYRYMSSLHKLRSYEVGQHPSRDIHTDMYIIMYDFLIR